jgi:D-alanyl-D-alanine dipeptidase
MADIKLQLVAGKDQTDLRGDLLIGKAEGDHHKTIKEFRVDDAVAQTMLPALMAANAKAANAIGEQLDILEAHRPGAKAAALSGLGVLMGEDVSDAEVIGVQTRIYDND